jgi:hypothetical protein
MTASTSPLAPQRVAWATPVVAGVAASLALIALNFAIVGLANSPGHARDLLWSDRYLVTAIASGFGLQVGLYVQARALLRAQARALRSAGAATAAGTGTSTVAMVACCAHHVADVLPVVGLSGAAIFLDDYRTPLMFAGLAVNALGIVVMLRLVRTTRSGGEWRFQALVGEG